MYKIFVVFNYETIIKGYYEDLSKAKAEWDLWKDRYLCQGYTEDITETKTDEEWVYTVTRIPFYGSSGDPGTGEVTVTPTGMTDTIEIHLELGNKSYAINDWKISCPVNYAKLWAMGKVVPVTPGPGPVPPTPVERYTLNVTITSGQGVIYMDGVPATTKTVDKGTTIQLQCVAATGYRFVKWSDGDTSASRSIVMNSDVDLSAILEEVVTYKLTLGVPVNGSITVYCEGVELPFQTEYTFNANALIRLVATPAEHYTFVHWTGDYGSPHLAIQFNLVKNTALTASFTIQRFNLQFRENDYLTFSGAGEYDWGAVATVTAIPKLHCRFIEWSDHVTANPRYVSVTGPIVLEAEGGWVQHTITLTEPKVKGLDGGTCYIDGEHITSKTVDYGTTHELKFESLAGKTEFTGWSDGESANPRTVFVNGDVSLGVNVLPKVQTYELHAEHGTIGIESGSWVYGENITVEFIPEEHYKFDHWDDTVVNNPRTDKVTGHYIRSGYGKLQEFTVSTPAEHFIITATVAGVPHVLNPEGISVPYGTEVTFSYVAEDHYHFSHWSTGAVTEVITLVIECNTEINIDYTTDPQFTVILHSDHGTVSGFGTYWEHDDVQIEVLSIDAEYQFKKWTQHGTTANWTITDITANYEDTVEYEDWHGLTVTCTGGDVNFMWSHSYGNLSSSNRPTIYWSTNRITWASWHLTGTSGNHTHDMEDGDVLYFKGDGVHSYGYNYPSRSMRDFTFSTYGVNIGYLHITGRITSLIDMHGREDTTMSGSGYFSHFFSNCGRLQRVDDELFPYTTGASSETFWGTFKNCTSLVKAPRLRLSNLAYNDCLRDMFWGCTSLNEIRIDAETIIGGSQFTYNVPTSGGVFRGPASCNPETGTAEHKWTRGVNGVPENWEYVAIDEE